MYIVATNDNPENITDTEVSPLKMKAPKERVNVPIRLARADDEVAYGYDSTGVKDESSDQENR